MISGIRVRRSRAQGRRAVVRIDGEQVRLSASDVANFLACRHLTRPDLRRARGVISPPYAYDVGFEIS